MYEDIKEQFAEVIRYSQGIDDPKIDEIFDRWAAAKEKFIKRFGGLIYKWPLPVEFLLDEESKKTNVRKLATTVDIDYHNEELSQFILDNVESFYENKISTSGYENVPKGTKLIKAFKYFEKDKVVLRNIQDLASGLIQENKIHGTLCFSIHPLDFLSSSENTYNWTSCHNLNGDYRAGNISYMLDNTTFMVYLKGEVDTYLPNFGISWNNKKWRMLMHTSEDDSILFAGRQYPLDSKNGIDTILRIYNSIIVKENYFTHTTGCWGKKYTPWQNAYIDSYYGNILAYRYFKVDNVLLPLEKIVYAGDEALNYNDLLTSSVYLYPYYATLTCLSGINFQEAHPTVTIGTAAPCLCCGEHHIRSSDFMRCDQCELEFGDDENDEITTCDCCGRRVFVDDAYWVDDTSEICRNCYDNYCFECERCGDVHYLADRYHLYDEADQIDEWVCSCCYEGYYDWKEQEREEKEIG